jgi:hypothetical protein
MTTPGQIFVVHNSRDDKVYVFDNHDAALRCRQDLNLDHWHLWGCVVSQEWLHGTPVRTTAYDDELARLEGRRVWESGWRAKMWRRSYDVALNAIAALEDRCRRLRQFSCDEPVRFFYPQSISGD